MLQDRFRNSLWIPSSVACSRSESGFLTKCSFGLLLIKPSGWRPFNWWTNHRAAILIRSASLGSLENNTMQIQDFNGIWTRDLAIPVRRSNQLSYEATDVGSWSIVGSNFPVRNESTMKWYMNWIIYELRIWNQVKLWSSHLLIKSHPQLSSKNFDFFQAHFTVSYLISSSLSFKHSYLRLLSWPYNRSFDWFSVQTIKILDINALFSRSSYSSSWVTVRFTMVVEFSCIRTGLEGDGVGAFSSV